MANRPGREDNHDALAEFLALRPPAIRVRGLSHHFGDDDNRKQVLFDVDLDLEIGEVAIVTGPSGSGKTTMLTLIGALRSVQQGSVQIHGVELAGLSSQRLVLVRRSIGFIFQAHNLFESLTARQNVRLALDLYDLEPEHKARMAERILRQVGLGDRLDYKPRALSGGQRQRVAIARALVHRPRLVLADEPTAALDAKAGREVVELFRELASSDQSAILLVTHDPRIQDVADRVIQLVDGRILSDQRPD